MVYLDRSVNVFLLKGHPSGETQHIAEQHKNLAEANNWFRGLRNCQPECGKGTVDYLG